MTTAAQRFFKNHYLFRNLLNINQYVLLEQLIRILSCPLLLADGEKCNMLKSRMCATEKNDNVTVQQKPSQQKT